MSTSTIDLTTCRVGAVAAVSDMARARAFYEGTLGLRPGDEQGDGHVVYPCGGGSTLLVYVSAHAGTATATVAGFDVPDVEAAVADLGARGVAFERYDGPGVVTDDRGIMDAGAFRSAWFRDPDGNTFALAGR
ncbi:MAG TPA: VOC family protein [Baekduia sp.]|nr:VOC family protein [Baekduia sp.]